MIKKSKNEYKNDSKDIYNLDLNFKYVLFVWIYYKSKNPEKKIHKYVKQHNRF